MFDQSGKVNKAPTLLAARSLHIEALFCRRGKEEENRKYISVEQWIRVRLPKRWGERGIKFGVIRHNTLLSLYHTALNASAP